MTGGILKTYMKNNIFNIYFKTHKLVSKKMNTPYGNGADYDK